MPKINYRMRPAVKALRTATMEIVLLSGQVFAQTPKAWVIWRKEVPHVVKRIPIKRVFFALYKEGWSWCPNCEKDVLIDEHLDAQGVYACTDSWGWCPNCEKDVLVDGRLDVQGTYDVCQDCGERI